MFVDMNFDRANTIQHQTYADRIVKIWQNDTVKTLLQNSWFRAQVTYARKMIHACIGFNINEKEFVERIDIQNMVMSYSYLMWKSKLTDGDWKRIQKAHHDFLDVMARKDPRMNDPVYRLWLLMRLFSTSGHPHFQITEAQQELILQAYTRIREDMTGSYRETRLHDGTKEEKSEHSKEVFVDWLFTTIRTGVITFEKAIAVLLHDADEDTTLRAMEIKDRYGVQPALTVKLVSKPTIFKNYNQSMESDYLTELRWYTQTEITDIKTYMDAKEIKKQRKKREIYMNKHPEITADSIPEIVLSPAEKLAEQHYDSWSDDHQKHIAKRLKEAKHIRNREYLDKLADLTQRMRSSDEADHFLYIREWDIDPFLTGDLAFDLDRMGTPFDPADAMDTWETVSIRDVLSLKLVDQLHNHSSMADLPYGKHVKKLWELETYYIPMAETIDSTILPDLVRWRDYWKGGKLLEKYLAMYVDEETRDQVKLTDFEWVHAGVYGKIFMPEEWAELTPEEMVTRIREEDKEWMDAWWERVIVGM